MANVGSDVDRLFRFVGIMTEAERGAMAEETQPYFEELGPRKGKERLHTYARIWLDLLEASASSSEEFNDYYTYSGYGVKVSFYVYLQGHLPRGFRFDGFESPKEREKSTPLAGLSPHALA